MLKVIIESPFAGDVETNVRYAFRAMRHSIGLGEAPMASHLLYPQVLNDSEPSDRSRGIQAGYEWMQVADKVAFYVDLGWSPGMIAALKVARKIFPKPIELRRIGGTRAPPPTPDEVLYLTQGLRPSPTKPEESNVTETT